MADLRRAHRAAAGRLRLNPPGCAVRPPSHGSSSVRRFAGSSVRRFVTVERARGERCSVSTRFKRLKSLRVCVSQQLAVGIRAVGISATRALGAPTVPSAANSHDHWQRRLVCSPVPSLRKIVKTQERKDAGAAVAAAPRPAMSSASRFTKRLACSISMATSTHAAARPAPGGAVSRMYTARVSESSQHARMSLLI